MIGATATVTEIQNNFDKYLDMVANGSEVIVTRDGREIGRFIPRDTAISYLTDALTGVLKNYGDSEQAREDALKAKYEIAD